MNKICATATVQGQTIYTHFISFSCNQIGVIDGAVESFRKEGHEVPFGAVSFWNLGRPSLEEEVAYHNQGRA